MHEEMVSGNNISKDRLGSLMVRASASGAGGRGFDPQPRQTKVFKTGSSGFPSWIMGIALRLARQCVDNGLVKYWLKKIVRETWICELSPLNN